MSFMVPVPLGPPLEEPATFDQGKVWLRVDNPDEFDLVSTLQVAARMIVEAETGRVLYAKNADVRNYPASLTKMMTLYMTFEALKAKRLTMDQALPVSARAAGMAPTKLGLRAGQTIRVEDAIYGLITKSANDAAVVLAEALGGSEIALARMMTAKARKLVMAKTTFQNANGLPNRH